MNSSNLKQNFNNLVLMSVLLFFTGKFNCYKIYKDVSLCIFIFAFEKKLFPEEEDGAEGLIS